MAKSVVVHKDKKVRSIFSEFGLEISLVEFKKIFKEKYPKDWTNINSRFESHEMKKKPGRKGHPMAHPEKYLENTYKVYLKKIKQEKYEQEHSPDGKGDG